MKQSMNTYISILRGINVSGKKMIKMDVLRALYQKLGFEEISTYVQSGNVVFRTVTTDQKKLQQIIAEQIKKEVDFEVPVLVLTLEAMKKIIYDNPFLKDLTLDSRFFHVTFLENPPHMYPQEIIESKKLEQEQIVFSEKAVYLYCPSGYGTTKLNNNFLESKLQVVATTRNWKTTTALLDLAEQTALL